jgi:hypothetical protein
MRFELGTSQIQVQNIITVTTCSVAPSYRVWQKYMTIWQNSSEWKHWRGEFVLERSSSETQSISVAMERWYVEHQAFSVETYLKNNSVLTQGIFRWHFKIHRNECPQSQYFFL